VHGTLPQDYIDQIKQLLGADSERFLQSYYSPRTYGLRLNPLKATPQLADRQLPLSFGMEPVPWCDTGYYYDESARPGKHPYHAAGLYYIQEPSAMTAAELLDPQPGEIVLDLAAAPGGKTTQIAGKMLGQGLLIANEIHPARAKILSENVERSGIVNAMVTCASPDELSRRFPAMFDRIMLDAPCSGEGMFRKDENAITEWSPAHVVMCAERQSDILEHAAIMLRPGGRLVYSTCTFNKTENEETIEAFCNAHPAFRLEKTERVWPHLSRGEGHFVAVLHKIDEDNSLSHSSNSMTSSSADQASKRNRRRPSRGAGQSAEVTSAMSLLNEFASKALPGGLPIGEGEALCFGQALYWLPHSSRTGESAITAEGLHGLKVVRPGLHLGDIRKNRLEPSHALALASNPAHAAWSRSFSADAPQISAYLRGETISLHDEKDAAPLSGWGLICVDGLPLGWGKASNGQIKNHYPKGLRHF